MRLSATQIDVSLLCNRKWWFLYHQRLPTHQRSSFAKGNVLHGACERFLKGEEVWPSGWDVDRDSKERLDPADAALIRVVVEKAIEVGYLEARPGSEVERKFVLTVDEETELLGFKDHEEFPVRIEDHKSSKSKRYLKGPKSLKKNLQMLIYAYETLVQVRKKGLVEPERIALVHNQFVLDPNNPEVKQAIAEVTPAEVRSYWDKVILPAIEELKELDKVEDPWKIPDPPREACGAFGGCPLITLCLGTESGAAYVKRIGNMQGQKGRPMTKTLSDFLKNARKAPPAAEPAINPPKAEAEAKAEAKATAPAAKPAEPTDQTPPWYVKACGRCKSQGPPLGFNTKKKEPCRICKGASGVSLDDFEWEVGERGEVSWWHKGEERVLPTAEAGNAGTKSLYTNEDLYAELRAAKTIDEVMPLYDKATDVFGDDDSPDRDLFEAAIEKRLEQIAEGSEPPTEPPVEPEPEPEPEKPKRRGRGKAKAKAKEEEKEPAPTPAQAPAPQAGGFIMLLNCIPLGREFLGRKLEFVEELLGDIEGYWQERDVWKRRQSVREAFNSDPKTITALNGRVLVACVSDPDVQNLVSTLLPHAAMVVRGTV